MVKRLLLLLCLFPVSAWAEEKVHPEVEAGNRALAEGKPEAALSHYEAAAKDLPDNPDLAFNRGGALYAQGKYQEAARAFLDATDVKDPARRAEAFRHYGDAELRQQNLKGAIQAYKQALSLNPLDEAARHNLEVALKQAKQQQQQQQGQQQQEQDSQKEPQSQPQTQPQENLQEEPSEQQQEQQPGNEDQNTQPKNSQGSQGEESKEPQEESGSPQSGEQDKKEEPKGKENPQPNPTQPGEPRNEETSSQKLLDALKAKEKSFLHEHRKRQMKGARPPVEKDW